MRDDYKCLFKEKWIKEQEYYDHITQILWLPYRWQPDIPATKTTKCIRDLGLTVDMALFDYGLPSLESKDADKIIKKIGKDYVLVHGRGISAPRRKNLTDDEIKHIFNLIKYKGLNPILLDRGNELAHLGLPAITEFDIPCLSVLIENSDCVYGIDSGVSHLANALGKPTFVFWKAFLPSFNFNPSQYLFNYICDLSIQRGFWDNLGQGDLDYMYNNYNCKHYETILELKEL